MDFGRLDLEASGSSAVQRLRVLVVPVGEVPQHKFQYYLDIIQDCAACDLLELTDVYTPEAAGKDVFPNRNLKEAKIYLDFEVYQNEGDNKTKGNSNAPTVLDELGKFQSHKRVWGAVGIALCHQFPDLSVAKTEFARLVEDMKTNSPLISLRCFAFEPMLDQADLERGTLVMIPNGEVKYLNFYVRTQILDMITAILEQLRNWVSGSRPSSEEKSKVISYPKDETVELPRLQKRKEGRLSKCKGDWCLLAGSPVDALAHYNAAIEAAKSNDDWMWHGGAALGYALGFVLAFLDDEADLNSSLKEKATHQTVVIEKFQEAITAFNKQKAPNHTIEASMRLAHFYASIGRKMEACELMMDTYGSMNDMPIHLKILVTSAVALLFKSMSYTRKFAFFIRETAVLYHKNHNPHTAHNLLKLIAKYYQLQGLEENYSALSIRTGNSFSSPPDFQPIQPRFLKDKTPREWYFLQKIMMQNLVKTSKSIGDNFSVVRHCVYLLKNLYHTIPDSVQSKYLLDIQKATEVTPRVQFEHVEIDTIGLPQLKKMTLQSLPPHLVPIPSLKVDQGSSIWLYTPMQNKGIKAETMYWVQGEQVCVKVELANPTSVEIVIQSIELSVSGTTFDATAESCTLPPRTSSYEVILTGKTMDKTGPVQINGCKVKSLNLTCFHPVNQNGVGISIEEYQHFQKNPAKGQKNFGDQIVLAPRLPELCVTEISVNGAHLHLYDGQRYECQLQLENVGYLPITDIEVSFVENKTKFQRDISEYDLDLVEPVFQWNFDAIKESSLPLLPSQSFRFPVSILSRVSSAGGSFTFTYSSAESPQFIRKITLNIPLKIHGGLETLKLNVLSVSQSLGQDDYCPQDHCLLLCEVLNTTTREFQLMCAVQNDPQKPPTMHHFLLEPECVKRVMLPIKQFTLHEDDLPPVPELRGQYIKPTKEPTEKEKLKLRMLYWYKHELQKRVSIKWKCLSLNTCGILQLMNKMMLTHKVIRRLHVDTLQFTFAAPGAVVSSDQNILPLHKSCPLQFGIKCNTVPQRGPFRLSIQVFQDNENGVLKSDLKGQVLWHGKLTETKDEVPSEMEIPFYFLTEGIYCFVAICENLSTSRMTTSTTHRIWAKN